MFPRNDLEGLVCLIPNYPSAFVRANRRTYRRTKLFELVALRLQIKSFDCSTPVDEWGECPVVKTCVLWPVRVAG